MSWCYLFSGQGAQRVGYLEDSFQDYPEFIDNINLAQKLTDYPLGTVFKFGPQEKLNETIYAQLFLFVYGYTLGKIIGEKTNIRPAYLAGLSIGEYTALCYAEAFTFEDGVKLVFNRANLMHKACIAKKGAMFALIGASYQQAKQFCEFLANSGVITIANYNAPTQIVIGCEDKLKERVLSDYKKFNIKRAVELKVEGAFHTPLMAYAAQILSYYINNTKFQDAKIPVISNTTAKEEIKTQEIKENLKRQIINPVLWYDSVIYLKEHAIKNFIELGPAGILSDLVKKTIPDAITYAIDTKQDLDNILYNLKN